MTIDHDLAALADFCGILPNFYDLHGNLQPTSPDTQRALLAANGIDVSSDDAIRGSLAQLRFDRDTRWFPEEIIVQSGVETPQMFGLGASWDIREDGSDDIVVSGEPHDFITVPPLPSGIYTLTATASGRTEVITVIAAPKRLPSIPELTGADRLWGLNVALYGLRSDRNAGVGDFADLGAIAAIAGGQGAAFVGINPLHAMGHVDGDAISPYSPSHRGYLNTACIALDALPGVQGYDFADLRATETVDYHAHKPRHAQALETAYAAFIAAGNMGAFTAFCAEGGDDLDRFARFETISETHGADWRQWPDDTGAPDASRVAFHKWLQWVAATQLADAQARARAGGMKLGLYLDLAVGSRRDGAESWCAQTAIAQGVSIGAPPDHLSPAGQNWDLAAFAPRKLKAERYRPLRRIIAQTIRHAGVIRIDHVLGLNRSYWIPDDGSPGGYITQPFGSLLAVIKIEAERHNCAVIGEDLGLVPDGFRDTMRDHGFYGYSVLQYDKDDTGVFRTSDAGSSQVLSCFATHDTPTVKGYETGGDIDWWEKLGWVDADTATDIRRARHMDVARNNTSGDDFADSVHARLAQSNACLAAVQLDDVFGAAEAQNLPGTIDEHPNWRRKYDVALESLDTSPALGAMAAMMQNAGRDG